ncbi:MAG: peptidylprolyl isomerase [Bacteroidetes bacterium]|nr:MAG: peptidylprolyl isomerase [Bacteroidota bacterium]TAG86002.1 MAG: peptidylprolyl isomerase [Bacteroidota bacterium]
MILHFIKLSFSVFIILFLTNCVGGSESPTKPAHNAHTTASGIKYVFHKQNPSGKKAKLGDLIDFHLVVRNSLDSVIRNSYQESPEGIREMPFEETYFIGKENPNFREVFSQVAQGDSLSFWIKADSLSEQGGYIKTKMPKGSDLKFTIKILKIRSREEIQKANEKLLEGQRKKDSVLIDNYVENLKKKDKNINFKATESGLRYLHTKEGIGKSGTKGDTVNINYSGKLLNGAEYQQSETNSEFLIGDITPLGLEEAISLMKEGGKSTFIIPSHLGYGEKGMDELVPKNTILVFDVELLKVKK